MVCQMAVMMIYYRGPGLLMIGSTQNTLMVRGHLTCSLKHSPLVLDNLY